MSTAAHTWRFFRAGGFDQVKLETGADLMHLDQLDQKLWVALACPASGLEFDSRTLALIDSDKDNRVRVPELIAAVKWAGGLLKNPDDLAQGVHPLPLSAIDDSTPDGKQLVASARQILHYLGIKDATAISVADASDANRIFQNTTFNGDGVIIPESADDDQLKALIAEIMATTGTVKDRSGRPGINQATLDAFFSELTAFNEWHAKAEADPANVLPLGEATFAAAAAVKGIKAKVDDYFGRCRLAAYDPRTVTVLNRREEEYLTIASTDLSITAAEVASFPLSNIAAGKPLPIAGAINPAHADAMSALKQAAVAPLIGDRNELTEAAWIELQGKLSAFNAWSGTKPAGIAEKLGIARVREILLSGAREKLVALIEKDKALEPEANAIANVEKLVRYVRDLALLCSNFVNFRDLYDGGDPAIFQSGVLYLDQRSASLCLTVEDVAKHATMAALAGSYLAYCECVRRGSGEKRVIVAIISQGDDDSLMVGRNGIFYDRKGRDYDATITKIVSNPISLRQAFWLPYKKFVRMIEEQIAKRAAAAEAANTTKLEAQAAALVTADKSKQVETRKTDVGTVAALGVAFGAIGGFCTAVATGFVKVASLGPMAIVGTVLGVMTLISGPSMILAYIKLRKRNLAPILDANGWAVNARVKINVPFGTSLTAIAKLPPGSQRDLRDAYAEKASPWPKLLAVAFVLYLAYVILNYLGYIHEWTKGRLGTERKQATVEIKVDAPASSSTTVVTNAPTAK